MADNKKYKAVNHSAMKTAATSGKARPAADGRAHISEDNGKKPKNAAKKQSSPAAERTPEVRVKKTGVMCDRGEIVDKGQVNMPRLSIRGYDYEIPTFDYIVIERKQDNRAPAGWDGGKYIATCVNLKMDGYGATAAEAWRDMNANVREYALKILEYYEYSNAALTGAFEQGAGVSLSSIGCTAEA
jgi:hypothetical protein